MAASTTPQAGKPGDDLLRSLIVPKSSPQGVSGNMATTDCNDGYYLPIRDPQFTADIAAQIEDNHDEEDFTTPPKGSTEPEQSDKGKTMDDLFGPPSNHKNTNQPHQDDIEYQITGIEQWEKENPRPPNVDDFFVRPKAVPLPAIKTTGEHASQFNHFCQKYGLTSDFHIREGPPYRYSAKVTYGSYTAEAPGPFSSKKEAKEAVCIVANAQNDKIKENLIPYPKRKQNADESPEEATAKRQREAENWVSMLIEYCQRIGVATPTYTEYQARVKSLQAKGLPSSGYQFACTVILPGSGSFGSTEALFNNKKDAKRNAAMEAVQYMRAHSMMAGANQMPTLRSEVNFTAATVASSAPSESGNPLFDESAPQKVARLSITLGFSQPSYDKSPNPENPSHVNMAACYLPADQQREPRIAGPLCLVEGIYGQKVAKQKCAEQVAVILEQLYAERLAMAEEMIGGKKAGEGYQ